MLAYEGAAVYRHDVIVGHGCAQSHLSHEVFHGLPVHREYHCAVHYEEICVSGRQAVPVVGVVDSVGKRQLYQVTRLSVGVRSASRSFRIRARGS